MSITGILIAAACVGIVGIFVGLFLGVAGIKFKVEVDEKDAPFFCTGGKPHGK